MPQEIERKFLIKDRTWKDIVKAQNIPGILLKQAYLTNSSWGVVRLRQANNTAFLTIKTRTKSITRQEYEYEIPLEHAEELFQSLDSTNFIEKTRYKIPFKNHIWEIDEFQGKNKGLIIAEIELQNEDESFEIPAWIGQEVTKISKYFNSNLSISPITEV